MPDMQPPITRIVYSCCNGLTSSVTASVGRKGHPGHTDPGMILPARTEVFGLMSKYAPIACLNKSVKANA